MILLANVDRLKNFNPVEEKESWFRHYIHSRSGRLLERQDYSELIGYMNNHYENGTDLQIGELIVLDDGKKYHVVQIVHRYYGKRRVTEFIVE